MPKKTYYEKNQTPEGLITDTPVSIDKKTDKQIDSLITNPLKKELKKDEIAREKVVPDVKPAKRGRPYKPRDEQGNLLTKSGAIDKRAESGMKNLQKSRLYQKILENKKLKDSGKKIAIYTPVVEDSSDEDDVEYEIVNVPKEENIPKEELKLEVPKLQRKGTEDFLKKQELEREKMLEEQLNKMKDENKQLKDQFYFNNHLNRISHLSTNVKMRFE